MAWRTLKYRLTSEAPILMHNGQTADPTNKWSKAMKQVSGKRSKTDADYEELARIEFYAALYMDSNGPIIPNTVIDSMVVNAAKKSKEGMVAKSGVFCLVPAPLEYDGPRTAAELWADEQFRFSAIVRVGMARVARMRPIFREWSAIITLNVEDTAVNPARIDDWMRVAGVQVGFATGDHSLAALPLNAWSDSWHGVARKEFCLCLHFVLRYSPRLDMVWCG
jgi:hypothetical protein